MAHLMSGMDDISYTLRVSAATSNVLTANDYVLLLQSLTGATAVTLPAPSGLSGRIYIVEKDASAQTVTITPASGNVDGAANVTLASGAVHAKQFVCDGTGWWSVASF
jgi:hypothetical protein